MSDPTQGAAAGFDARWLQQREPFDLAARDPALATAFASALTRSATGPTRPTRLIDLAAGTGANFRALAPLIGGDQHWLLIDHDPRLLAAQHAHIAAWAQQQGWRSEARADGIVVRAGAAHWQVRGQPLDLAASLQDLDLQRADGIVTTAFLDLVSSAWLDRFSALLAHAGRPLLATLTVDGRREWQPPLPGDAALHAAFLRHQAGDKGFGASLGTAAVAHLAQRLSHIGFDVHTARSDWYIGPTAPGLLRHLAREAAAVADATAPTSQAAHGAWLVQRAQQIDQGLLSLRVGHDDLLALPPRR
jgi:hypothetical protein